MYGRFDDVAEVREEMDGPGVVGGEDWGMGGGEKDAERCKLGMTICGLACQNEDGCGARATGGGACLGLSGTRAAGRGRGKRTLPDADDDDEDKFELRA